MNYPFTNPIPLPKVSRIVYRCERSECRSTEALRVLGDGRRLCQSCVQTLVRLATV